MTDFAGFKHGGVTYPLPAQGAGVGGADSSLLRDADPTVFYMLEYYASVIETHVGARLVAEAVGADVDWLTSAVREQLPTNPEPYLTESHLKFPLLSVCRKSTTFKYMGQRKLSVDTFEVCYVLQPLGAAEAERLLPILKAIVAVIDSRTEQGFDPAYTPSQPAGTAGEPVWSATRAGLSRVEVTAVSYGSFQPLTPAELSFPAAMLTVMVEERCEALPAELAVLDGVDGAVDLQQAEAGDTSTLSDLATFASIPAPVLVGPCSPATGSKAGLTPVTIPCTGLVVGRAYRVLFAGADASNVVATSTTELTCVTPQVSAFPTLAADVYVIDRDRQLSNVLTTAFTFTSP